MVVWFFCVFSVRGFFFSICLVLGILFTGFFRVFMIILGVGGSYFIFISKEIEEYMFRVIR